MTTQRAAVVAPQRAAVALPRPALRWLAAAVVLLSACRRQEELQAGPAAASPASGFEATLPSGFEVVQLRGEGSERLLAPSGAHVLRTAAGFRVQAGPDFDVEVVPDAPAASEYRTPDGVSRSSSGSDATLFVSPEGTYSFVVVRELVPEWDESRRHRLACGSAGGVVSGAATRADSRWFAREATQIMVAACRTLELPPLE